MIAAIGNVLSQRSTYAAASFLIVVFTNSAWSEAVVPQIMLTNDVVERVETLRRTDAAIASDYEALLTTADSYLDRATIVDALNARDSTLQSGFVGFDQKPVERLTTLGMAWRLTRDKRYAERTKLELMQLADLETWHPEHFLGLSRVTLAIALGYSWIGETLDESEHSVIRSALIDKALNEANRIYKLDKAYFDKGWVVPQRWVHPTPVPTTLPDGTATADITWPVASFNWNIICNTGMIVAALAVSEAEPELATQTIESAQTSIRNGFAMLAPDGAWPEGPMYGALSARDAAIAITSLETVLGHDFDLSKTDGMANFGDYLTHATGPSGMLFNYGDSDTNTDLVALTWLASHFNRPDYNLRVSGSKPSSHIALDLIWRQKTKAKSIDGRQNSFWFGGLGLVTMRTAWDDPQATYVGFKAGPLRSHHNNLDAGTFVLEADGVRWAVDLGIGNYHLPGYFTNKRFDYYRTATIGQNTLTFNSANQQTTGRAQIEEFGQFPDFTFAIADLSEPYAQPVGTVRRGIALIEGNTVVVQDEIKRGHSEPVFWTMHTDAQIHIDGQTAILRKDGKELLARILSPPEGRFTLRSADPCKTPYNSDCADQNPNTGVSRLMIDLGVQNSDTLQTISVTFESIKSATDKTIVPLSEWRLQATLSRPDPSE
ncbi:Heparinase II/III-like protein [Ruegeria halocynthiae]|uniref:Heparinase II/III-like protein n=2 Tax=Ruegeria halocynthiae TaxID=985054 RepID=A0A1H2WCX6_9RHOB|nr:Heparinase II/III-like protein [Ruegeria halocynthiae]